MKFLLPIIAGVVTYFVVFAVILLGAISMGIHLSSEEVRSTTLASMAAGVYVGRVIYRRRGAQNMKLTAEHN